MLSLVVREPGLGVLGKAFTFQASPKNFLAFLVTSAKLPFMTQMVALTCWEGAKSSPRKVTSLSSESDEHLPKGIFLKCLADPLEPGRMTSEEPHLVQTILKLKLKNRSEILAFLN